MTTHKELCDEVSLALQSAPDLDLVQKAELLAPLINARIAEFHKSAGKDGVQTFQCQLLEQRANNHGRNGGCSQELRAPFIVLMNRCSQ